jgi:peptidoglycan/xylan/chitin deacetylase (PgdA/CDA1 family)
MEVSVDTFAEQIRYLETAGTIVSLEDALSRLGTSGDDRLFVLTFDDGYADMYANALPVLLDRSHPFTLYLTTLPLEDPSTSQPGALPLTWQQVEEMVDSKLATIGAHTHTHPDLRFLSSDDITTELDQSNQLIEKRLGVKPRHFAYPKGWWSADAESDVRKRYDTAVLGEGPPNRLETDRHRLHRVAVQKSDGMRFFRRKLSTGLVLEDRLRRVVRKYDGPPEPAT